MHSLVAGRGNQDRGCGGDDGGRPSVGRVVVRHERHAAIISYGVNLYRQTGPLTECEVSIAPQKHARCLTESSFGVWCRVLFASSHVNGVKARRFTDGFRVELRRLCSFNSKATNIFLTSSSIDSMSGASGFYLGHSISCQTQHVR